MIFGVRSESEWGHTTSVHGNFGLESLEDLQIFRVDDLGSFLGVSHDKCEFLGNREAVDSFLVSFNTLNNFAYFKLIQGLSPNSHQ